MAGFGGMGLAGPVCTSLCQQGFLANGTSSDGGRLCLPFFVKSHNNSALEEVEIYFFHEATGFSWELFAFYFLSLFISKNSLHTSKF